MTNLETHSMKTEMANDDNDKVLTIERTFNAPVELVYRAWTDPQFLSRWWGPEGMSTPTCDLDVRPGGIWRTCMVNDEGGEHWVQGIYKTVEPPHKLAFTWAWEEDGVPGHETLISLSFSAHGDKTEMLFVQEGFDTAESCTSHFGGWSSSFVCLTQELEQQEA